MSKSSMGALVQYCGHNGCFIADIWHIGNINVVVASQSVLPENLDRQSKPTHHISDFPKAGYWKPFKGIFVVPQEQVKNLKEKEEPETDYRKALEAIATLWPIETCAKIGPDWVSGVNDGRNRAIIAEGAITIARKALGIEKMP